MFLEAEIPSPPADPGSPRFAGQILANASVMIVVLDADGRILEFNPAAERITGYTKAEMSERDWFETLVPRERYPAVWAEFGRLKTGGPPRDFENPILTKAGEERQIAWRNSELTEGGRIAGIVSFGLDVTEQRRTETAARQVANRLAALLATTADGYCTVGSDARITDVNDTYARMLGWSRDELIGKPLVEIDCMPPAETADHIRRITETGFDRFLTKHRTRDGRTLDVEVSTTYVPGTGELVAFCRDVAAKLKLETELRASEALFRQVFEMSTVGRVLTGPDGRFLQANQAFCDMLGYDHDEMKTIGFAGVTHPEDIAESRDYVAAALAGRTAKGRFEKRYLHRDGRIVWGDVSSCLLRDERDRPVFFITDIKGIDDRKAAEAELRRTLADLKRSNEELERFAYVASHDLQEPLRMVGSYLQLLERRYKGRLDAEADEFITFAVDGARRMKALINDLLAFSRIGTRGAPPVATPLDAVLDQALANLRIRLGETGATITRDPLPTLPVDEVQMVQLFQNLIDNALKFRGPAPAEIQVSCAAGEGEWRFSVRDNGIGIDPRHFDRIFIIFQRLHGVGEYPGTGIGLALVRKIVERHGGRIWVESTPGHGAAFHFTLPERRPAS